MLFIKAEEESALNYTVHKVVLNNAAEKKNNSQEEKLINLKRSFEEFKSIGKQLQKVRNCRYFPLL